MQACMFLHVMTNHKLQHQNIIHFPPRVKRKVEEYEFDAEMEPSYRNSLFKSFNTTLDKGFFPMVIVDAVHEKVCVCVWGGGIVSGVGSEWCTIYSVVGTCGSSMCCVCWR